MTREEKIIELERMLQKCPEMLSPKKVSRWTLFGKNKVYELIKTKELKSFVYQIPDESTNVDFELRSHPEIVNGLTSRFRDYLLEQDHTQNGGMTLQ